MTIMTGQAPNVTRPHTRELSRLVMTTTRRTKLPRPEIAAMDTPVLSHRVSAAGLCADSNDDKWFPPEPKPEATAAHRRAYEDYARAVCLGCPVMPECRELALRDEARPGIRAHGIWGGLAPWERDGLRKRRRQRARRERARRELAGAAS